METISQILSFPITLFVGRLLRGRRERAGGAHRLVDLVEVFLDRSQVPGWSGWLACKPPKIHRDRIMDEETLRKVDRLANRDSPGRLC